MYFLLWTGDYERSRKYGDMQMVIISTTQLLVSVFFKLKILIYLKGINLC